MKEPITDNSINYLRDFMNEVGRLLVPSRFGRVFVAGLGLFAMVIAADNIHEIGYDTAKAHGVESEITNEQAANFLQFGLGAMAVLGSLRREAEQEAPRKP